MSNESHNWLKSIKAKLFNKKSGARARLNALRQQMTELSRQVEQAKILAAQGLIREMNRQSEPAALARSEFKVFSQFGDDGIIQYILQRLNLPVSEQRFVEFGVESYMEANTRFLLVNNNWSGLIMDGSEEYMASVRKDDSYGRHELTVLARFITRENINALLEEAGFSGRIGLLSIDIDGNDYWVWEAITVADPAVVIVEYNSLFGAHDPVTIPYQADFTRTQAHYSNLYWGTSLPALCLLAARKNYVWIGCNSAGNNAYFVRKTEADRFICPQLPEGFVEAKFREGRNREGRITHTGQRAGFPLVKHLPVWDVAKNQMRRLEEIVR